MRVLVACEFSGIVREAFRARGHDAMSCDLLPSEQEGPHYQGDVFDILYDDWDLIIAHPPCRYLCSSGLHWNSRRPERQALTDEAAAFFMRFTELECAWVIENSIGCMSKRYRKPDQIIQPWMFGHPESKGTCLWLHDAPPLLPTNVLSPPRYRCKCGYVFDGACGKYGCPNCNGENKGYPIWENQTNSGQNRLAPSRERWKERAKTYSGIAQAMAEQWG